MFYFVISSKEGSGQRGGTPLPWAPLRRALYWITLYNKIFYYYLPMFHFLLLSLYISAMDYDCVMEILIALKRPKTTKLFVGRLLNI